MKNKVSFKTVKPTGKWRSFEEAQNYIKLNGLFVGTIHTGNNKIGFCVIKDGVDVTDTNPNCDWMWCFLKKESATIEEAKEFIINNIDKIIAKYKNFHTFEI